jgi:hypothetical protein
MPNTTSARLELSQPKTRIQPPLVRKAARKHWLFTWPGYLVWILAPLLGLVIYSQWSQVSGIELNTHTWEQRSFSFHRDPLTGWQLSSVKHNVPRSNGWWSTVPNPHAKKISTTIAKYLPKKSSLPLRWDLVRLDGTDAPAAAASILLKFLDAEDRSYREFWPQWSTDHPQRAAILWPAAHQLVELGQYTLLPDLFDLALLDNSLSQLSADVGQLVQTEL